MWNQYYQQLYHFYYKHHSLEYWQSTLDRLMQTNHGYIKIYNWHRLFLRNNFKSYYLQTVLLDLMQKSVYMANLRLKRHFYLTPQHLCDFLISELINYLKTCLWWWKIIDVLNLTLWFITVSWFSILTWQVILY